MNCLEFERDLQECLEGSPTPEQQAHLDSCSACSGLVLDLNAIASQAKFLSATEDPSPTVWDALESRLRSEGLIRHLEPIYFPVAAKESFWRRWRGGWLVPVAAALVIVVGVKLYRPASVGNDGGVAKVQPAVAVPSQSVSEKEKPAVSAEDKRWLQTVSSRPPAQLASFRDDLDQANAFIRDAQQSLQQDPNDVYLQQMVIHAYEQKQMLYQLAVDQNSQ